MTGKHYDKFVPDIGPENAKIMFVGEAPGADETAQVLPFVGASGQKLMEMLAHFGISRQEVRLANLFHFQPHDNKFENVLQSPDLIPQVKSLYAYIESHQPNVVVPLGNWPLLFLCNKKGISRWRGSIIPYTHENSIKCIPTYHPSYILRDRSHFPTAIADFRRIIDDSNTRNFNLPIREHIVNPQGLDLEEQVQRLSASTYVATDIETVKRTKHILCVGFASSPKKGVSISAENDDGKRAISRILDSPTKKVFHNGSFDYRQLTENGYTINDPSGGTFQAKNSNTDLSRIYYWDTMVAQHVIAPELPRSLAYVTSIYTREPYYKHEGKDEIPGDVKEWSMKFDREVLGKYNSKDCCCTAEVYEKQITEIESVADLFHVFCFEMHELEVADHISSVGMLIDEERRSLIENLLLLKWRIKQFAVNGLLGAEINVRSPKLKNYLYDKVHLGLPTRRDRGSGNITTDEDAIVSLIGYCKDRMDSVVKDSTKAEWEKKLLICKAILEIRGYRQVLSTYIVKGKKIPRISLDGRLRSTYGVAATETGRWNCKKYVDGTGINATTLPRDPVEIEDHIFEEIVKINKAELGILLKGIEDEEEDDELEEVA